MTAILNDYLGKQQQKVSAARELIGSDQNRLKELDRVLMGSDYVADQLQRHPELISQLNLDAGELPAGALTEQVLESQHARAFLKGVMRKQKLAWDHNPRGNAANEYIRNSMPIYELEKRARFPKV